MDNYVHNISLGVNCTHKMYLNSVKKSKETHVFEWTGCSMWAVNELLANNFEGLLEHNQIEKQLIFPDSDKKIFTQKNRFIQKMGV